MTTTGPIYSRDRQWVWDGARWQPAVSADGSWGWNGFEWVPVRRAPGTYRLAVISMICGIAALLPVVGYPVGIVVGAMAMQLSVANGSYNEFEALAFLPALGVVLLPGLAAIVTGSVGLKRLGRWRGMKSRRAMARTGQICGIAAFGVIPILLLELVIFADS